MNVFVTDEFVSIFCDLIRTKPMGHTIEVFYVKLILIQLFVCPFDILPKKNH